MNSWRRPVGIIVAITLVVETLMVLTGMGPRLLIVGALGALVGAVVCLVRSVDSTSVASVPLPPVHAPAPPMRVDWRVRSLRTSLAYGRNDTSSCERLYDTLVELIDDELTAVHGIDRRTDPTPATAIIGDDLARFVADRTAARSLSRLRTVARIVTLIEQIPQQGAPNAPRFGTD